jgi:hypothetical protein
VTMKSTVVWDVTPCGFRRNRHFGETCHLHHQGGKNQRADINVFLLKSRVTQKFITITTNCNTND